jgi:hypothetical protein
MAGMVYALPWLAQPRVVLAIAALEVVLGVWLLAGTVAETAWCAAVMFFSGALCSAVYMTWAGVSHCPCFGAWQVAPGRVLWFDLGVLGLLAGIRPGDQSLGQIVHRVLGDVTEVMATGTYAVFGTGSQDGVLTVATLMHQSSL